MRIRPHKPIAAFSMVELMVAVSLLLLMLGTLYSSWAAIMQSTRTGSEAATNVQRERVTVQHVADALAGAVMVEDGEDWYRFKADTLSGYSSLSFVQRIPESNRKSNAQSFRRVSFSVEPSSNGREWELVRRETPVTQAPKATPVEPQELVRRVRHFKVELLDAEGEWKTHWTGFGRLPRRARISVAVGPGGPEDVRVREVSLMSSAITHGGKLPISVKEFEEETSPIGQIRRHVFVIDKSASMSETIKVISSIGVISWSSKDTGVTHMNGAKGELKKRLDGMNEEDEFFIIFFDKDIEAMPTAIMPATPDNIDALRHWIDDQEPAATKETPAERSKGPSDALGRALEQEPDVIWLLCDGEFSSRVVQLVEDMNPSRPVRINTLSCSSGYWRNNKLRYLATENGGTFGLITPASASASK